MTNTCWKWDLMFLGVKGRAPGSWNTMVTISLPMCLFLNNWREKKSEILSQIQGGEGGKIEFKGTHILIYQLIFSVWNEIEYMSQGSPPAPQMFLMFEPLIGLQKHFVDLFKDTVSGSCVVKTKSFIGERDIF